MTENIRIIKGTEHPEEFQPKVPPEVERLMEKVAERLWCQYMEYNYPDRRWDRQDGAVPGLTRDIAEKMRDRAFQILQEMGWVVADDQRAFHFADILPRTECIRLSNLLGTTVGKVAEIGESVLSSILNKPEGFKRVIKVP